MKKTLPLPLTRRLDSHLLACSAIAAGVSTFTATKADAAIIYSGLVNAPIQPANINGGMYFDFENPGQIGQGAPFTNWDVNPYASGTKLYIASNTSLVANGKAATNLLGGTSIGPSSIYSTDRSEITITVPAGASTYLGFKFTSNNTSGTTPLYGWAEITPSSGTGVGTLVRFAYETSGAPIAAGAVPEPSSLSMLALGAFGLTQLRRRRAA